MTIKGALWWQGENNAFQCHDELPEYASHPRDAPGGGPMACGDVADHTGYACKMKNLIDTWRQIWSTSSDTSSEFPFGIVSLAGGTSEGNAQNMGALRYAQSLNAGVLPTKDIRNVFVAQAYDAGDPCAGGNQCCTNKKDGQGGWPCFAGIAKYTGQFMGGLHPRVKRIVGERLAAAARALVYKDETVAWTGPVLRTCEVKGDEVDLYFDAALLGDDTVMVTQPTDSGFGWAADGIWNKAIAGGSPNSLELAMLAMALGPESPLEIQLNGTNFTDGVWVPATPGVKCNPDEQSTTNTNSHACPTQSGQLGNRVSVSISGANKYFPGGITKLITGIRYAWGGNPCCPTVNRFSIPCPPASCPIQSWNATLPAVPFWATINRTTGNCTWISTQGGATL